MKGRDTTILEKEKEITHLNRELRQMENSKYVFQHKIIVLQIEIRTKEEKIDDMKQQILDMERELTKSVKQQSDNAAQIDEVKASYQLPAKTLCMKSVKSATHNQAMATYICNKYVSGNAAIHGQ